MAYHELRKYDSDFHAQSLFFFNIHFLAHWHPEIEFVLVCEGSLTMGINSESRVLRKGDIAVCTSGDIHYYDSKDDNSIAIVIVFRPEIIMSIVQFPPHTRFLYPFLDHSTVKELGIQPSVVEEIKTNIETILHELTLQESHYETIVKGRLAQLFGLFLRHVPQYSEHNHGRMIGAGAIRLIQKAIEYIELNYMENISLDDVSASIGASGSYLSRMFSTVTGMSFKAYLNHIRIQKADVLLQTSNKSIIDIALECGFNSIRTFNRVFKELKGYPPSSLR